jgi:hypothetical protein
MSRGIQAHHTWLLPRAVDQWKYCVSHIGLSSHVRIHAVFTAPSRPGRWVQVTQAAGYAMAACWSSKTEPQDCLVSFSCEQIPKIIEMWVLYSTVILSICYPIYRYYCPGSGSDMISFGSGSFFFSTTTANNNNNNNNTAFNFFFFYIQLLYFKEKTIVNTSTCLDFNMLYSTMYVFAYSTLNSARTGSVRPRYQTQEPDPFQNVSDPEHW